MAPRGEAPADLIDHTALTIRNTAVEDGAAIWRLVRDSGTLDVNSCYAYLLLATHFADTCLVAHAGDKLAGFIAGYRPPSQPEVLFVWQVGVASEFRGQGLGRRLLAELVARGQARGARFLEATVTPGNKPSLGLFRALANANGWQLTTNTHFDVHHFADASHDMEMLVRIGPLKE